MYLAEPNEANDVNHKTMKKDEIKDYDLCDQYYTNKLPFVPHLFYSIGDIYKYAAIVMFIAGLFSLIWSALIINRRIAQNDVSTNIN